MDRMRQLIAEHMRRSKDTSAHVTSFAEVDVTGLVRHRETHKKAFEAREGVKLTYTPYFIAASIEPLRAHPFLNASVEGSRILVRKDYHIGIAVALEKGLLVPVVRNAGQQNLSGLAHSVADLAARARTKKLQPDELQGGTFTITNVGSLGSLMGTPIINQPQSAILSPGRHRQAAGRGRGPRAGRRHRDPPHGLRLALVRPPHHRRRDGGELPRTPTATPSKRSRPDSPLL